ncbi:MFS transporter [Bradyrhizobium diazoefficiens]|nr:MFS transporter [Bradyrhizobium diazoefficiens]QQN62202.1 MFS transporter [Bradyrhizobium diazoefficiens]
MTTTAIPLRETVGVTREERKIIFASSLGTVFEWYDFFLYGSLAAIIGATFFGAFPPATQAIFALLAFAAGSLVRTFGALVFGRVGDLVGRKYTFLVTILIMGLSTFLVGLLPGSATFGIWAPIGLIMLRLLQGLALGGEYGGAAIYVAEHAPPGRRGFYTSWIQTTATLGLFLSLLVILGTRTVVGEQAFQVWGWRVPFLFSSVLLGISVWIRMQLNESPVFRRMKVEGKASKAPLTEAFGRWSNIKIALIALFGLVAGQAVVWYTGQFYVLFFLQSILKVDGFTATLLVCWSLLLGSGFFVVFGWLSDKVGRKPIIIGGCLLAAVTYSPIFQAITEGANPALARALETVKVTVAADPAQCGDLFNPVGNRVFTTPCDLARAYLAQNSVRYDRQAAPAGEPVRVVVNGTAVPFEAGKLGESRSAVTAALQAAGYPKAGDPSTVRMTHVFDLSSAQVLSIIGLLFVLAIYVTMVYGPMAAALVELFPARIRYSGLSLPYHIGNGWFGGLLPAAAFAMVAQTGDIYFGLWYPIVIAAATFIIGLLTVPETKDRDITDLD